LVNTRWYLNNKDATIIIPIDSTLYPHCELSSYEFVDPETVGQWTGLVDKNGVKIFEDDIIKCSIFYDTGCYPHTSIETRVVTYKSCYFNPLCFCEPHNYTIIGNIYDNPELGGN
jgi:uncharacterized phage protein (TIGR01671 family)